MHHQEADETLAVERYLLGDMGPTELEHFEEHLFTCPECAESVKSGARFVAGARTVFQESAANAVREQARQAAKAKPLAWWRSLLAPALVPALAALALCFVAGYQQLVVIPGLRTQIAQVTAPQPLASYALHALSRGAPQAIVVPAKANFYAMYFDVATESASGYSCAVLGRTGSPIFTEHLPPPTAAAGTLNLLIGRSRLPAGEYTLVVSTESTPRREISRYVFQVDYQ